METPLKATIQTRLAQLLAGELPFDDFWDWLIPLKRHPEATGETRRLIFEVTGRLYEYEHGDWSDEGLREQLLALVPADLRKARTARTLLQINPPGHAEQRPFRLRVMPARVPVRRGSLAAITSLPEPPRPARLVSTARTQPLAARAS